MFVEEEGLEPGGWIDFGVRRGRQIANKDERSTWMLKFMIMLSRQIRAGIYWMDVIRDSAAGVCISESLAGNNVFCLYSCITDRLFRGKHPYQGFHVIELPKCVTCFNSCLTTHISSIYRYPLPNCDVGGTALQSAHTKQPLT